MALNASTAGERSLTMAVLIMAANTAGIVGSQIFQQDDRPLYRTGWTVIVSLVSLALVASVVANTQYYFLNKRRRGTSSSTAVTGEETEERRYKP
jgi:hypothetical protein